MPRGSDGSFTLAAGGFVPSTPISNTTMNTVLSDIATGLSQTLTSTGVSFMRGQFLAYSGVSSIPSYAFGSDTVTGIYLAGSHQIGMTTNGTQAVTFNSDQSVTYDGNVTFTGASAFNGTSFTLNGTSYTFGAGAASAFWAGLSASFDIEFIIDDGGLAIGTGQKGQLRIPFPATVISWFVTADQVGSIVVDILRANNAVPSSSMIGAGNIPTLSSSQGTSATVAGWTSTALAAADFIAFNVTSATTVTRVSVVLHCTRTGS